MHRDQKIGLSLAVLIVGFAAAFCFRNDQLRDAQPLALDQAAAIDARIEQLPIRAYTQREGVGGITRTSELLDPAADVIDVSVVERPALAMEVSTAPEGDVIDLFAGPPEPLAAARTLNKAVVPDRPDARTVQSTPLVLPATPEPSESSSPPLIAEAEESTLAPSEKSTLPGERTYIVKSGDTLSGVSFQMYGKTYRYLDIYQANRDILSDPNDLPVGTTLRIP